MQLISSFVPSLPLATDLKTLPAGVQTSDVLRVKTSTETHADLTVMTSGGDRITLSAESLLRASYTSMNAHSSGPQLTGNLQAMASDVRVSKSIAVSVQGHLDQREEADLQQLVEKLNTIVKQFLGGDPGAALGQALDLGDLGTVASFELHVQELEKISIMQRQSTSAHRLPALEPQTNLLFEMVDSINDAHIDLNKLLERLPQMLRRIFEEIAPNVSDQSITQLLSDVETLLRSTDQPPDPTIPKINTPA
jgi:hypothetical protein